MPSRRDFLTKSTACCAFGFMPQPSWMSHPDMIEETREPRIESLWHYPFVKTVKHGDAFVIDLPPGVKLIPIDENGDQCGDVEEIIPHRFVSRIRVKFFRSKPKNWQAWGNQVSFPNPGAKTDFYSFFKVIPHNA